MFSMALAQNFSETVGLCVCRCRPFVYSIVAAQVVFDLEIVGLYTDRICNDRLNSLSQCKVDYGAAVFLGYDEINFYAVEFNVWKVF